MANRVQGKNIKGYLKIDGVYYNVFCGMTLNWRYSQELLETTNVNSGSTRDFEAGMSTANCSISGVHVLDNTESRISWNYLQTLAVRRQKLDWKVEQTDDDGTQVIYIFQGLIQDGGFSKSIPGYSKSDVNIQVCGDVDQTAVDPPPSGEYTVHSDRWTMANGSNEISGASSGAYDGINYTLLATDIILDVVVENQILYEVAGTPTTGTAEFQFVTSPSVKIVCAPHLVSDGTFRAFVMFKRAV